MNIDREMNLTTSIVMLKSTMLILKMNSTMTMMITITSMLRLLIDSVCSDNKLTVIINHMCARLYTRFNCCCEGTNLWDLLVNF